MSIFRAVTH